MENILLSHLNHWKTIPYKNAPNFRAFYYEGKDNLPYFLDWDKILKYGAALGYDGVELLPWDMTEILGIFGSAEAFRDFAAERGTRVSGMFHGMDGARDKAKHAACIAGAKSAIQTIAALGGQHMNISPESDRHITGPLSREEVLNIGACLEEIGRIAEDHGVHMGLHTEFSCAINVENHDLLLENTDPKYVHYCLDTAPIAMMGEDIVAFYERYHDRICAVHLKDTADPNLPESIRHGSVGMIPDDGHRWFWEPGEGVIDFESLWKLMKKYNFQGWVSVEDDGTPDLLASMALSSYYVHEKLKPIYW